jgi:RNA polymerase sigma-70 factor (ECF subfamily)
MTLVLNISGIELPRRQEQGWDREAGVMEAEERFEELFSANYRDLLAYAVRRCPSRQDAEDVIAETFAVAWRRIPEIPEGDEARLWLFGTAHLVRLNHQRGHLRREGLFERMRQTFVPRRRGDEGESVEVERIHLAFASLNSTDREVLQLHVWEQLTVGEIATTLGVSNAAVWKRLQRARDRLAKELDGASNDEGQASFIITRAARKEAP